MNYVFSNHLSKLVYLPKGFNKINNFGNNIKEDVKATNIVNTVNKPKYIVGTKFENINIDNQ